MNGFTNWAGDDPGKFRVHGDVGIILNHFNYLLEFIIEIVTPHLTDSHFLVGHLRRLATGGHQVDSGTILRGLEHAQAVGCHDSTKTISRSARWESPKASELSFRGLLPVFCYICPDETSFPHVEILFLCLLFSRRSHIFYQEEFFLVSFVGESL